MLASGRTFYKMSGSGNDFVVVDTMREPAGDLANPATVQALCARATGIGADGVVFLEPSSSADYRMTYLNSDGSRADLCGNASLCSARLAIELGIVTAPEFRVETDAGVLGARLVSGVPEVDLQPVTDVRPGLPFRLQQGEQWIGFALAGVPHLTVRVTDVGTVDVVRRGRELRFDPSLAQGANVNFVSPDDAGGDGWRIRTYERGVEGETLACGTGAVASAILLSQAGEAGDQIALRTRSTRVLTVRLSRLHGGWQPSLSGEARVVFEGRIGELESTPSLSP
ncbi:MAG: Diaminopimelate epimerase [Gemmatimonadetes bacterium]|jgi:diaminopimelate epimerase|nr:Diaminopimelate epimerase [Gemmatimonadota bacterium]